MSRRKPQSEFGEGLVQQLCYFTNHFDNDMAKSIREIAYFAKRLKTHTFADCIQKTQLSAYARVQLDMVVSKKKDPNILATLDHKTKGSKLRAQFAKDLEAQIPHMIELWANGATDHLYGIKCLPNPNGTRTDIVAKMDKKIYQLQRWGLRMGHGFRPEDTAFCSVKNFERLKALTNEIARLIDQHLGVKSDPGSWQ